MRKKIREYYKHLRVKTLKGASSQYQIKPGYDHRSRVKNFDDTGNEDHYQNEVYWIAEKIASDQNLSKIIDYGCGSGYKLAKYFRDYETLGLDVEETILFCRQKYPHKSWKSILEIQPDELECDLLISSDVIEHVEKPDRYIEDLLKVKGWEYLLISTPERNTLRGMYDFGPPVNESHFREWNLWEFRSFISQYMKVENQMITNVNQATQLIIARRKQD